MSHAAAANQPAPAETHERTRYDDNLWERATTYARDHDLTSEAFGALIDYDGSTMRRYFSRSYVNTAKVEEAILNFFAREERKGTGKRFSSKSENSMRTLEACEYAWREREMVVVYGATQIGKSAGAEEFIRRKKDTGNRQIIDITVSSVTTPGSLLRRIGERLQLPRKAADDSLQDIIARLKGGHYVLVLDDAGYLNVKACQALYRLMEDGGCGVVLIGVRELLERIFNASGRLREDLLQFTSRCVRHVYLEGAVPKDTLEDIARRTNNFPGEKVLAAVLPHVKTPRDMKSMLKQVQRLRKLYPEYELSKIVGEARREVFRVA